MFFKVSPLKRKPRQETSVLDRSAYTGPPAPLYRSVIVPVFENSSGPIDRRIASFAADDARTANRFEKAIQVEQAIQGDRWSLKDF